MKVNELNVFENKEFGVVRNLKENGKEYFYANDIAKALGYSNLPKAITTHCKNPIKKEIEVTRGNSTQRVEAKFITEGDIYRLIIKSKLPKAQEFETWVFDEVLPSIRKNGVYISENITTEQIKKAQEYLNITSIKKKLLKASEEDLEKEYKLIRSVQKNKKEFDDLALKQLKKRDLGVETNKLIFKLYDKQKRVSEGENKRLKARIERLEPKESEYSVIDYHPFSVNQQYDSKLNDVKIKRTKEYWTWLNEFPVEQLPDVSGIDFTKPVDIWLKFDHCKRYDVSNFSKSILDKACWTWGVNDRYVQLRSCVTNEYTSKEEGKIYICVKQGA